MDLSVRMTKKQLSEFVSFINEVLESTGTGKLIRKAVKALAEG